MNKKFIILAFITLISNNVQLCATPKSRVFQIFSELAMLPAAELHSLQKDTNAMRALTQVLHPELQKTLCPKELLPFLENPAINSLVKSILNS